MSSHSGEMSQGLGMANEHRTPVPAIDPAARKTKRAFDTLSAGAVGLELGMSVVIGILVGMWLDSRLGTSPWLLLLFLVLGVVAGFRGVLRAVKRVDRAVAEEERRGDP
jgi:ATP synthase protein I